VKSAEEQRGQDNILATLGEESGPCPRRISHNPP
jgi:hypothetical protein